MTHAYASGGTQTAQPAGPALNGLLLVDKPGLPGSVPIALSADGTRLTESLPYLLSSHDVVQRVRRWSGQRRIGHTGTLDPLASGLLVLCLGWATRLVEYYQGHDKEYLAEILLGCQTDAWDVTGRVTGRALPPPLSEADVVRALEQFRGTVLQKPPVFSAVKQGGETAYRKARRGEEVELAPRPVTFSRLELVAFAPPDRILLDVRCSAGAYIRSLAHELGGALGTAATLLALRRTGAGPFRVDEAASLADLEQDAADGTLAGRMLAPGARLDLPVLAPDSDSLRRFGFGQEVTLNEAPSAGAIASWVRPPDETPIVQEDVAQVIDARGTLAGIARRIGEAPTGESVWRADKWFYSESDADIQ